MNVRVTYDAEVDVAYIDFTPAGRADEDIGGRTVQVWLSPVHMGYEAGVDVGKRGKLEGIEILNASKWLHPETLAAAERI